MMNIVQFKVPLEFCKLHMTTFLMVGQKKLVPAHTGWLVESILWLSWKHGDPPRCYSLTVCVGDFLVTLPLLILYSLTTAGRKINFIKKTTEQMLKNKPLKC